MSLMWDVLRGVAQRLTRGGGAAGSGASAPDADRHARVGLIARAEPTGLSVLTYEFYRHIHPQKVLVVDLTRKSGNAFYPGMYGRGPSVIVTDSVPYPSRDIVPDPLIDRFLDGLDVVFTAETPYNYYLFESARKRGIRTILQPMFEFLEYHLDPQLPPPDVLAVPSLWRWDDYPDIAPRRLVPVPVNRRLFPFRQRQRADTFFVPGGKPAPSDRNGVLTAIQAFSALPPRLPVRLVVAGHRRLVAGKADPRIRFDCRVRSQYWDVYPGRFDVALLPRKYGGLCLPLNEMASVGAPVVMTDVSPQCDILPPELRVPTRPDPAEIMEMISLKVHEADVDALRDRILTLHAEPAKVAELSGLMDRYAESISWDALLPAYRRLLDGEP